MPLRSANRKGPHPVDIHVGQRLRLRRTLLGLSQEKLGEALGLTFQQLQKYERGSNRISASRLFELSRILDVPISFFFDEMVQKPEGKLSLPDALPNPMNKRETLELVRAYYGVSDPTIRRSILDLTKAMAT